MLPTIEEDIRHVINEFKEKVNPEFKPTRQDIENIKKILGRHGRVGYTAEENGKMYTRLYVEALKKHNVKDFSFIQEYDKWIVDELEELKSRHMRKIRGY